MKLRPTLISTGRVPESPSSVFRITGGSAATKAIMMMVQALRPKITRNSGYISTSGADAMAAIQVSVASRTIRLRCSSTPSAMPTTLSIRLAISASPQVKQEARKHVLLDQDALEAQHDLGGQRHDEGS